MLPEPICLLLQTSAPAGDELQDVGSGGIRALLGLKTLRKLLRRHVYLRAVIRVQQRIPKLRLSSQGTYIADACNGELAIRQMGQRPFKAADE